MEQKYASMLQQVLAQKRLELLQSENVIQVMRSHQQKVKQVKVKEIQERKLKKGQDPPESSDQVSSSSKTPLDASSRPARDVTDKSNAKTPKTPKKSQQNKKSPGKVGTVKEVPIGQHLAISENATAITKPPPSDLATKAFFSGVSVAPSTLAKSTAVLNSSGQTPLAPKNTLPQVTPVQALTMAPQQIPRIGSVFSYQTGNFTKICLESVKDHTLNPPEKSGNHIGANQKVVLQNTQSRIPQKTSPFQTILPNRGIISGNEKMRQSLQSLTTPSTMAPITGSSIGLIVHQNQHMTTYPLTGCTQGPCIGHIPTSASPILPSSQHTSLTSNWPDQVTQGNNTGGVQTGAMQDDFLLEMLQTNNKDLQGHHGTQSQTNNTLSSLGHMITDQSWPMSIGM